MKHALEAETSAFPEAGAEVWLWGNWRPALVAGGAVAALAVAAVVVLVAAGPPLWIAAPAAVVAAAALLVAGGFVWAAARPRLVRRGDILEIRLSPVGVERVPIEVVECIFPGSQPLGVDDGTADRRVGTLVLRLAERATAWRSRPVASAWGAWDDGNVVFDGRWCEPLSQTLARDLSNRLLEARRQLRPEASA
ncbi:MAG: hypothetical protein ACKO4Z_04575 [Planctomycetota bacterium]